MPTLPEPHRLIARLSENLEDTLDFDRAATALSTEEKEGLLPTQQKMSIEGSRSMARNTVQDGSDIEARGMESVESMEFDKLKVVKLSQLEVGTDYEYCDPSGDYFPVNIIDEDEVSGNYIGRSIFQKNKIFTKIKAGECIESAPRHKVNWINYLFWVFFDIGLCVGLVFAMIHGLYDALSTQWYWLGRVSTYALIPIFAVTRLFWHFVWPAKNAVHNVSRFVCKKVEMDGKEVYFVGTMHVSPGSVNDVRKVIDAVDPDVIMIELDHDRLQAMKEAKDPQPCDQPMWTKKDGTKVRAVHADWNASLNKQTVVAKLCFDANVKDLKDKILVVPSIKSGHALFVWNAQKRGAAAVFFIDNDAVENQDDPGKTKPSLIIINSEGLINAWRFCLSTGRNTPPTIPTYLVPARHFQRDREDGKEVTFIVKSGYLEAPSTCRQTCCRFTCVMGTGIGIMYGLIRLAGCKVGQEFILADELATQRGKAFATIDMGMGRLGKSLLDRLIPYPRNLWYLITFWAALPRHMFVWLLLPQAHKLDLFLNMMWGFGRFHLRTWAAFLLGSLCASAMLTGIIFFVGYLTRLGAEQVASSSGASDENVDDLGKWIATFAPLVLQVYLYPVVYKGLLDSRDEQMYRGAVAQIRRRPNATKFVIVIGAAHSNGMIRRMYLRGFMPDGECEEARRKWAPFPFNIGCLFNPFFY
eukprot:GEMP01006530.1.p1 GENE.GEMP01006530.1~~GEMP01006530.1.p1  ORF type:complete len:697 (+),score=154.11 GEMP01006530.1:131-2221(+)